MTPNPQQHERLHDPSCTPTADSRNTQFTDRTPKVNHTSEFAYNGGDTGYCSARKQCNGSDNDNRANNPRTFDMPRLNSAQTQAQFNPTKYQERLTNPSNSSGWSCSASMHSNDAKVISPREHTDASSHDMKRKQSSMCTSAVSDASSLDGNEFSLQNTKKVLSFDGDSQSGSITDQHEQYSHQYENREYVSNSQLRQNTDVNNRQLYARSNSVDELEFDRPRHKVMEARSNSMDDLDFDEPRERQPKPVSTLSSGHENLNKCANSVAQCYLATHSTDASVKSKHVSSKETSEMGSPINSARLRPIRQRTRNAIVNIMDNGEVCLEFVKQKHKEERVVEVFVITQNGNQVQ